VKTSGVAYIVKCIIEKMTKEEFIRFIKERGVYKAWIRNSIEYSRINNGLCELTYRFKDNLIKFIEYYVNINQTHEIIMNSFHWNSTPEGGAFWNIIYSEITNLQNGRKKIEDYTIHTPSKEKKRRA
jgi:hypothetical protein